MNNQATKQIEDTLESIIDSTSLWQVLESLLNICYGKAEHLQSNWQDDTMASQWNKAAKIISQAQGKLPNIIGIVG